MKIIKACSNPEIQLQLNSNQYQLITILLASAKDHFRFDEMMNMYIDSGDIICALTSDQYYELQRII